MNLLRNILHTIIETIWEEIRWRKLLRKLREAPSIDKPWRAVVSELTPEEWREKMKNLGRARY